MKDAYKLRYYEVLCSRRCRIIYLRCPFGRIPYLLHHLIGTMRHTSLAQHETHTTICPF
jgi:hypothetical protein